MVDMSHNVEQKFLNFLQNNLKICRKLISMFSRKHRLVIDHLLDVGHDVVHVLGSRELALLALVVQPHVSTRPGPDHLGTGGKVAELRHGPVQQVDVLEESYGWNGGSAGEGWSEGEDTHCAGHATRWRQDRREPPWWRGGRPRGPSSQGTAPEGDIEVRQESTWLQIFW